LVLLLRGLELGLEARIVSVVEFVENFHLEGAEGLPPSPKLVLYMRLELLFALTILVHELPVIFGLAQLLLCAFHVFQHLVQTIRVLVYQSNDLLFFADIVPLMNTEERTVRAYTCLAARQADKLLWRLVLAAETNGFLQLLFLLFLDLSFRLSEAVMEIL